MTTPPAPLFCANHPGVETSLRCNQCNKPICPKCAVHTPTGYRCRECVRGRQKVFENAQWMDYLFGSLTGFVLSAIASFLVMLISSVTGFFAWFIIAAISPAAAAGIAEALRLVTRRHRSKSLFITLLVAVALGVLPAVLLQVMSFNLWGLLFLGIYAIMAVPTVYYRLSGINYSNVEPMLTELRITDFAIIDQLELKPEAGLLVFTGETGAGKSIIMDALDMLLGGKTDQTAIRMEAEMARVEGVFQLSPPGQEVIQEILRREDLLDDPLIVTLSREVRREGRSTARINGRSVSLALLKELGELLVDIHGQSEHLSLLNVRAHLDLLDRYAASESLLLPYKKTHHELLAIRRELEEVRTAQSEAETRHDMLTYQAEEIEAARLKPGEEETLKLERDRLANAESLAGFARQAITVLDEGSPESPAATDLVGEASAALSRLAQIDPERLSLGEQAVSLTETLAELVRVLRDYLEAIEFNPTRLEEVEERLDLIHRLCRKFGGSIESVIAFGMDAHRQLESISTASERIASLEEAEGQARTKLAAQALALSQKRKGAAADMGRAIEGELDDLRMASARFEVDFQTRADPNGLPLEDGTRLAFDATGFDRVEFLIAPNPGEGPKPLARIASGGETSRLMLALKNVLARADHIPTLIFDEIDQGIGGRVGGTVGEKLWNLGRSHQVFVITHLPQLAVFGDSHYQVQKIIEDGRTLTRVALLDGEPRTLELAGMLGTVTEGTIRSAHDILQSAETFKKEKLAS